MQQRGDQRNDKVKLAMAGSLGAAMVIATALGFAAGYYLDRWLGTEPWFTLILLVVGMAAGIWTVIKEVLSKR